VRDERGIQPLDQISPDPTPTEVTFDVEISLADECALDLFDGARPRR
jgi:hypothetical protein